MVRLRHAVSLAAAMVLFAGVMAGAAPGVAASGKIAFGTPTIVDPIHTFGEPDIGIDPQGRVFSSGPTGTGTQRSVWFGSVDQGHTFRTISPGPPPSALSGTIDPPGGGDTDINFDRSGQQYFTDLYALTCLRVATTPDGGATVRQNVYPGGCSGVPGADMSQVVFPTDSTGAITGAKPSATLVRVSPHPMHYDDVCLQGAGCIQSQGNRNPAGAPTFYAGRVQSVDLCSVSACFPHVLTYPEPGFTGGSQESGSLSCPAAPSATNPCVITVKVNTADVGSPAGSSLLEEVGSYALAASHPQGATTNAQALADNVPLEIDGVCCYNFR